MKLPIKKIFFDQIKDGSKDWEYRDAHITFVCEETGEHIRKNIVSASFIDKGNVNLTSNEEKCFDDDRLIRFALEK